MQIRDFGPISDWRPVEPGVVLTFDAEEDFYRQVDVDVIAPDGTEAQLIVGDAYFSLGTLSGPTTLRYGVTGSSGLVFDLPEGAVALVRTKARPMVISETGAIPLTKAEPRRASGVEQEMRRLMMLMQHRNEQRMAEREREFNRRLLAASAQSGGVAVAPDLIEQEAPDAGTDQ